MKKITLFTLICLILSFLLSGCSQDKRDLFFYKDANNIGDENTWIIMNDVGSLDNCKNLADGLLGEYQYGDYECGLNCKFNNDIQMNVCKETIK